MKKLVLTLALVFGVLAANAQYFVGGQLGLLYDDASENYGAQNEAYKTIY